jgi:hypothetical protein
MLHFASLLATPIAFLAIAAALACATGDDPRAPAQGGGDDQFAPRRSPRDPTAVLRQTTAPRAVLRAQGGSMIAAGIGPRCWGEICADYPGPVTNSAPIVLEREEGFQVNFEAGPPASIASAWVPVTSAPPAGTEGIIWTGLVYQLMPEESGAPNLLLGPGRYVFVLKATWANQGEVIYAFYVERK